MILLLEDLDHLPEKALMARVGKTGSPGVRGPSVVARSPSDGRPLERLHEGEKLHIVGSGTQERVFGKDPAALVRLLLELGLSASIGLKQIHFIADDTGVGGAESFAARFAIEIEKKGLRVDEIKAPVGKVRCDSNGKIWICSDRTSGWLPSNASLNFYAGPRVQPKHLGSSIKST